MAKIIAARGLGQLGIKAGEEVPAGTSKKIIDRYLRRNWLKEVPDAPKDDDKDPAPKRKAGRPKKADK